MLEGSYSPEHENLNSPEIVEDDIDITEFSKKPLQERPAFYNRRTEEWQFQPGKTETTGLFDALAETTQDYYSGTLDPDRDDYGEIDEDNINIKLEINKYKDKHGDEMKRAGFYITYGLDYEDLPSRQKNLFVEYDGKPSMSMGETGYFTGAWTPDLVEDTNRRLNEQYGIEFDDEGNVK